MGKAQDLIELCSEGSTEKLASRIEKALPKEWGFLDVVHDGGVGIVFADEGNPDTRNEFSFDPDEGELKVLQGDIDKKRKNEILKSFNSIDMKGVYWH